jgi:transcriptional regulator of arginine metabolism
VPTGGGKGLTGYAHYCIFMRIFMLSNVMPPLNTDQQARRDAIRELLAAGPVDSQQVLVDELCARGLSVTQSSISRDLRDLGAVKTARGYTLPGKDSAGDVELGMVAGLLRSATPAGANLLVVKTAIGAAQRVALAFDRSEWPEIVGNIGGDDTVFVATASAGAQKQLLAKIERSLGR